MEKFRIIQRHEWYSSNGIVWSKWYQALSEMADNEEDLKPRLDECEKKGQELFKTTKMKIEYKIDKFDYIPLDYTNLKGIPNAEKKRKRKKD